MDRKIIFLHDGCRRYDRRFVWEAVSHEVLRSPLEDRETYAQALAEVEGIRERLLERLAGQLNRCHGIDADVRYWRMIIGSWLLHYCHVVYERYAALSAALERYPDLTTIMLSSESYVTPVDTAHFVNLVVDDPYNLQLATRILRTMGKSFPDKPLKVTEGAVICGRRAGFLNILRDRLAPVFSSRASVWVKYGYFPTAKVEAEIFLRSGGGVWFDHQDDPRPAKIVFDAAVRQGVFAPSGRRDGVEGVIEELLPSDIPWAFVEGYEWISRRAAGSLPRRVDAVVSANAWHFDEVFKSWAAGQVRAGARVASVQHGAIYGMARTWPLEEHEMRVSDIFYSWGWGRQEVSSCVVKPLPATKMLMVPCLGADNEREGILLTTNCFPRFFYRFQDFRHFDNEAYFLWQQRFIAALPVSLREAVRVRLYMNDMGCDCRVRWKDFDPQVRLEDWSVKFQDSLKACRLHVTDHMASTFIDGFVADKPTVLFWDPQAFQLRPSARPFFDALKQAGILFDTPEAAAVAAETIYLDVERWWSDDRRQRAVRDLCARFAMTSADGVALWAQELAGMADKKDGYARR